MKNRDDIPVYMSCEEWDDIKDKFNQRRTARARKERKKRALYFRQQRLFGASIIILGIVCIAIGFFIGANVMQCFGVFAGLIGFYIMLTKSMVLLNDYYFEFMDKVNQY